MNYSQQIGSKTPGLFLILLDQSGSMQDQYGDCTKAQTAAEIINNMIYELQESCTDGGEIKPRLSLGVIGYGDTANPIFSCKISEVEKKVLGKQRFSKGQVTCAGHQYQSDFDMPVWVKPQSYGSTPMHIAFDRAGEVAVHWLKWYEDAFKKAPDSFPPMFINVSDGEPDDVGLARASASRLVNEIRTTNGSALLFNVHISGDRDSGEIVLPATNTALASVKSDQRAFSEFLYDISSVLPDALLNEATKAGLAPQPGSRGFIFNATASTLFKMIRFGSNTMGSKQRR